MKKIVGQLGLVVAACLVMVMVTVTVMGGGPAGALSVANNLVNSAKIINDSIQGIDIRNDTVASGDIRNGTVGVRDMNDVANGRLVSLLAFVDARTDGATLLNGRGVASVGRIALGAYSVTFTSPITDCGKIATLTDNAAGVAATGQIAVEEKGTNAVCVRTTNSAGEPTGPAFIDGFTLMVLC